MGGTNDFLLWTRNLSYWNVCLSDRRIEGLLKVFD